jgi:hypothetical protein
MKNQAKRALVSSFLYHKVIEKRPAGINPDSQSLDFMSVILLLFPMFSGRCEFTQGEASLLEKRRDPFEKLGIRRRVPFIVVSEPKPKL